LDIQRIKTTLQSRAAEVQEKASQTQCMQVLRDICVMACVDEKVTKTERAVMEELAQALGVPVEFINQSIDKRMELD
jgi:tellurite resistance protein